MRNTLSAVTACQACRPPPPGGRHGMRSATCEGDRGGPRLLGVGLLPPLIPYPHNPGNSLTSAQATHPGAATACARSRARAAAGCRGCWARGCPGCRARWHAALPRC